MRPAIVTAVNELREWLDPHRRKGSSIGLVPTMGALHEGHGSLVIAAREACDLVVTSIFVNPLQFGPGEDLDRYPRIPEGDAKLLGGLGCDLLFMPGRDAMFPDGFATSLEMEGLTDVLCGASRPGHFSGVLTVVLKLFNQVQPDVAFFGQKDYQQTLVIRRLVRDLDLPLQVRVCPIVREPDGLAMSSRNAFLDAEQRVQAPGFRQAYLAMDRAFGEGEIRTATLLEIGRAVVERGDLWRLEYLEIRDPETLAERTGEARAGDLVALAGHLGSTRLIDNGFLGSAE